MSRIVIPECVIEEDAPDPVHWRSITIVEGIDPDGDHWIAVVHDGPEDEMRSLVDLAAATFPLQRTRDER